eukprot:COSAG01_NODE_246_length_20450_cov_195.166822_24_plen_98_part_00
MHSINILNAKCRHKTNSVKISRTVDLHDLCAGHVPRIDDFYRDCGDSGGTQMVRWCHNHLREVEGRVGETVAANRRQSECVSERTRIASKPDPSGEH